MLPLLPPHRPRASADLASGDGVLVRVYRQALYVVVVPQKELLPVVVVIIHDPDRRGLPRPPTQSSTTTAKTRPREGKRMKGYWEGRKEAADWVRT